METQIGSPSLSNCRLSNPLEDPSISSPNFISEVAALQAKTALLQIQVDKFYDITENFIHIVQHLACENKNINEKLGIILKGWKDIFD